VQVRRRRRWEGWRSSRGSPSTTPRSPTPAAPAATLVADALDSGALPALEKLHLHGIPASATAKAAVYAARANLQG